MTVLGTILSGRPSGPTGNVVELARYSTPSVGERVIRGQRVDGSVRFLLVCNVVLAEQLAPSEDDACRSRHALFEPARSNAARPKRPNAKARPAVLSIGGSS